MRNIETEILVLGGGATGTGIVRDAAMRGFKTVLVERRDLAYGTTGRYNGIIHSGSRYAPRDIETARECIRENRILRRIMPQCIEDTGGFVVATPWDDPAFGDVLQRTSYEAGIPFEECSVAELLRTEPHLNPGIQRCFRVPDVVADSFLAAQLNAESARLYGAQILTYHEVTTLVQAQGRIVGAMCRSAATGEELRISADLVLNATGAWAGKVAATAGIGINIISGKGSMMVLNHRLLNSVVTRCRPATDCDSVAPSHSVTVLGSTDVRVEDPDHFGVEPWEVQLMLAEGDKILPGVSHGRKLRAWAGVRPLYQGEAQTAEDDREISRTHIILDHSRREGVGGMLTIVGGKWTTYRQMAEDIVDAAGRVLGSERECRTHLEPLPGARQGGFHIYTAPLKRVETDSAYSELVCECELVTRAQVEAAILEKGSLTVDDIRRHTRLGMGTCQGGFCTHRAAGLLRRLRPAADATSGEAARDFIQERWKGTLPVIAANQVRQQRLNELISLEVLALDRAPGEAHSPLAPDPYVTLT
jgi:glycerol-3-phosphate dehydrogenase